MKARLKMILAILDALPVMTIAFFTWQLNDGLLWPALITALLLFCWHFAENALLRSRFDQEKQISYVGYMEWPNMAFTGIILAALLEKCIRFFNISAAGIISPAIEQHTAYMGCLITVAGIVLRMWAYLTLKEEFSKAPGLNKKYIQRGPYRFAHHPANIGFFLIGMGVATGLASPIALITGFIFLLPSLVFVSRFENKLLRTTIL